MLDLSKFSPENLNRIKEILKIILDELEIQGVEIITCNKFPLKKIEQKGFCYEEIKTIFEKIAREENNIVEIWNEDIELFMKGAKESLKIPFVDKEERVKSRMKSIVEYLINKEGREKNEEKKKMIMGLIGKNLAVFKTSEKELKSNLFLKVRNLDKLKEIKEAIDKELKKIEKPKEKLKLAPKISLSSQKIIFNDNEAVIEIDKQKCSLPPYKNEHYFCRAVFEYQINEPIDWSIIYEKMTGYYKAYYGKPQNIRENWRLVYDTMKAINKRMKEVVNTDDNLFTWQEKTLKRNY